MRILHHFYVKRKYKNDQTIILNSFVIVVFNFIVQRVQEMFLTL